MKEQKTRYFFVCTIGEYPNGTIAINNFSIKSTDGHPTYKRCEEVSKEKFPNVYNFTLASISEIKENDWNIFISEQ